MEATKVLKPQMKRKPPFPGRNFQSLWQIWLCATVLSDDPGRSSWGAQHKPSEGQAGPTCRRLFLMIHSGSRRVYCGLTLRRSGRCKDHPDQLQGHSGRIGGEYALNLMPHCRNKKQGLASLIKDRWGMELESIMLSEISQPEKDKYHMTSLM